MSVAWPNGTMPAATAEAEPPEELCRVWAGRCAQVHLEDVRRGVHEHLPPGEGDVDFPAADPGRPLAPRGATTELFFGSNDKYNAHAITTTTRRVRKPSHLLE